MRRLEAKWLQGTHWPKRLEWMEISGLRGWAGYRIEFRFPITAIVGENGSGKSTILQAAAASYKSPGTSNKMKFASDFFPDTPWDKIVNAQITYSVREGTGSRTDSVRKPTNRWRGNPERRERHIYYIDLSRIQPLSARSGYLRLAKANVKKGKSRQFGTDIVARLSAIMGINYKSAELATASGDPNRLVPVVQRSGEPYSGFHQGAGELTAAELLANDFEKYSLVIIDEIESSLHPRAQRRLLRDLANIARDKEIQFIISTHSPYILQEIPPEGRMLIVETDAGKSTVIGVSPDFAMSKMDEENHPESDVYVEDEAAAAMLRELVVKHDPNVLSRVQISPFGAASVGLSLGIMTFQKRFPRPTVVFLDGDQAKAPGVHILPGGDAPERVIFTGLKAKHWPDVAQRVGRSPSQVIDALEKAMTAPNHHDWVRGAADPMFIGATHLLQVLCAAWANHCATDADKNAILLPIKDALENQ